MQQLQSVNPSNYQILGTVDISTPREIEDKVNYLQRHKKVIEYYQSSLWLYRLFCYTPETFGLHLGFWDHATKNRQEAILNENQAVIELGKINKHSKALDVGCGIGGTAFYIAKKDGRTSNRDKY